LAQKFSGIKVYNALALTVLLYGIEIWSLRKEREREREKKIDINQNETFRIAGHTLLDHKRNEEILEELKLEQNEEKRRRSR